VSAHELPSESQPTSPFSRSGLAWIAFALILSSGGILRQFGGLLEQDLGQVVARPSASSGRALLKHDASYVSWVVGRNARTLATQPWRLFDAEPCAPAEHSLALGEPAISLGLLGIPHWLLTRDPIRTYNLTLLTVSFIAPMAMFFLIWSWTGQPAAGIAAGLVFGFQAARVDDPIHLYLWDHAATVLAFLFARRLLLHGRWRDAAGLAGCIAFQLGGSLYALLGSALVAAPVSVWLLHDYGVRALRPAPVTLVLGIAVGTALLLLIPALGLVDDGTLTTREEKFFYAPVDLLPGGAAFPGWPLLGLAVLGVGLRLRGDASRARWALLAGAALAIWLATGPMARPLPDLYQLLSVAVPGLEVVRAPAKVYFAALMALAALAGLGAAALLQRVPEHLRAGTGVALALCTAVATLRPGAAALAPSEQYEYIRLRPSPAMLLFFEELERKGSRGPLYEIPLPTLRLQASGVLLTEYHRRRSSACASSFSPRVQSLEDIWERLPDDDAVRILGEAGFTTLLVHTRRRTGYAERFEERLAALERPLLRKLHDDARTIAYAIELP
jgi:hypothetical protein